LVPSRLCARPRVFHWPAGAESALQSLERAHGAAHAMFCRRFPFTRPTSIRSRRMSPFRLIAPRAISFQKGAMTDRVFEKIHKWRRVPMWMRTKFWVLMALGLAAKRAGLRSGCLYEPRLMEGAGIRLQVYLGSRPTVTNASHP
jgi:hypothetical protein